MFDSSMWNLIFRGVILPIFVGVRIHASDKSKDEVTRVSVATGSCILKKHTKDEDWIATNCMQATQSLVGLLSHFFDRISFLLDEVLALLTSFVLQGKQCALRCVPFNFLTFHLLLTTDSENLAEIGCTCLLLLVMKDGVRFTEHMWNIVCITLDHVLKNTTPTEIFAYVPPPKQPARGRRVSVRGEGEPKSSAAIRRSKSDQTDTRETPKREKPTTEGEEEAAGSRRQSQEVPSRESSTTTTTSSLQVEKEGDEVAAAERVRLALLEEGGEESAESGKTPEELMLIKLKRATPYRPPTFSSLPTVKARCGVHLLIIQAINEIFHEHFELLSLKNVNSLLDAVTESHKFAYGANNDLSIRTNLSPTGKFSLSLLSLSHIQALTCVYLS